jgi:hypothetical protein
MPTTGDPGCGCCPSEAADQLLRLKVEAGGAVSPAGKIPVVAGVVRPSMTMRA